MGFSEMEGRGGPRPDESGEKRVERDEDIDAAAIVPLPEQPPASHDAATVRNIRAAAELPVGEARFREEVTDLITLAENDDPAHVMRTLEERAEEFSYDEVLAIVSAVLENDPSRIVRLRDLALSRGEMLGVVMRFARESTQKFLEVAHHVGFLLDDDTKVMIVSDVVDRREGIFSTAVKRLEMSHTLIEDVLRHFPPEKQQKLLNSLDVPGIAVARPASTPESYPRDPEGAERVAALDRASRSLMYEIEMAFPDRADAERARFHEEQRLLKPIVKKQDLLNPKEQRSSAALPVLVRLEGEIFPAVYKPKRRERRARSGIEAEGMAAREALVALIDRALQLDLVPPTVLRDGPEGVGAAQAWKTGTVAFRHPGPEPAGYREQLKRLALLDWLTRNSDRHDGNWLIGHDGKIAAIDNGATFATRVDEYDGVRSFPAAELHKVGDTGLPEDLRRNVDRLLDAPEVMSALKDGFVAALGQEKGGKEWFLFERKLRQVSFSPEWELPNSEWLNFPK